MENQAQNIVNFSFTEVKIDHETGGLINAFGRNLTADEERAYMAQVIAKGDVTYEH
jgi:hypothetical protein